MKRGILALVLLLTPALSFAADQGQLVVREYGKKLDGVALNASAATRTFTLNLTNKPDDATHANARPLYSRVRLQINFTHSAATDNTVVFSCSLTGNTADAATVTTRSCGSGTCKVYGKTDNNDTSGSGDDEDGSAGDEDYLLEFDVSTCRLAEFVIAGTSGGASDLVDVTASAAAGW